MTSLFGKTNSLEQVAFHNDIVRNHAEIKFSAPFCGNIQFYSKNLEISRVDSLKATIVPSRVIGHFTVVYGSEAEGDLVLIQTLVLCYVNQVILMLTSIFQEQLP